MTELDFDKPLPEVVAFDDLRGFARTCPLCGSAAVVPLTAGQRAEQPDDTTHVCHPALDGCNHGFARRAASEKEVR